MTDTLTTSQGSTYTDNDRREACAQYIVLGNVQKVSDITNIPRSTIATWKASEWWVALVDDLRQQKSDQIDANITKILDSASEALTDRIEKGDPTVIKYKDSHEIVSVPMKGRDLATVFGITFDKRQIIRNLPTSIKAESTDKRLNALADKVRELQAGSSKVIEHEE